MTDDDNVAAMRDEIARLYTPPPTKDVIAHWLWIRHMITVFSRREVTDGSEEVRAIVDNARRLWPLVRNARVYRIPLVSYMDVYHAADVHTMRDVAGFDYDDDNFDNVAYYESVCEAGENLAMPAHLPFPSFAFVYDRGLPIPDFQLAERDAPYGFENSKGAPLLFAHVVSQTGEVWEIMGSVFDDDHIAFFFQPMRLPGGTWLHPISLVPWVVSGLIDFVNEHGDCVHETGTLTRARGVEAFAKRSGKRSLPPDFYVVEPRDRILVEYMRDLGSRTWGLSHRFDVAGHERVRVRRGPKPIDGGLHAHLDDLGYELFFGPVPDAHVARLEERGMRPKSDDEWMALKVTWIDGYVKGPESAPYVPAVREVKERT